jgi:hypothetical protein
MKRRLGGGCVITLETPSSLLLKSRTDLRTKVCLVNELTKLTVFLVNYVD